MGNRGWAVVVSLLALLLVGVYSYWFFINFEAKEREVRRNVSKAAQRNSLLAAERFLTRIGRPAESVSGRDQLVELPPPGDALLVNRFAIQLPVERQDALEQWLQQGGHLIVAAFREWDEESDTGDKGFLDRFGVRLQVGGCGCPDRKSKGTETPSDVDLESDSHSQSTDSKKDEEDTLEVLVPGRSAPLHVAFARGRRLLDAEGADWVAVHGEHAHLQQFQVGAGRLTVLSDNAFFHNDHIGEADHALFLADLTAGAHKVWLLYSSDMPSLFALLWQNQPFLVVSALLTALLWLAYLTAFSGPRRTLGGSSRRSLLEHLEAAAAYAWQVDRARGMLQGFRDASAHGWERHHHQLGQLSPAARCQWIAEHSGLSLEEVKAALYDEAEGEQDFVRVSAAQQRVLISLKRGKNGNERHQQ